jgi:hypothetical protein
MITLKDERMDKIEITPQTLYNLFRVYNITKITGMLSGLDDEQKAYRLFEIIKNIQEDKNAKNN